MNEEITYRNKCVPYDLYLEAVRFTLEMGAISSPMLQRKFGIPYSKSSALMDLLELNKIVSEDYAPGVRKKVIYKV